MEKSFAKRKRPVNLVLLKVLFSNQIRIYSAQVKRVCAIIPTDTL